MNNYFSLLVWNICHRVNGHGVHSPFIYHFITKVVQDKTYNFNYDDIEFQRKLILKKNNIESIVTKKEVPPPSLGLFLYRLIYNFQCIKTVEIGGATSIMSLYMALANSKSTCYVLEDRYGLTDHIQKFVKEKNIDNIDFLDSYEENIQNISYHVGLVQNDDLSKQGCIFVNRLSNKIDIETIFYYWKTSMNPSIIWVLNNIRKDKKMNTLWIKINQELLVRTTIDLYHFGIAFFDENLPQKKYQKSFRLWNNNKIKKN